MPSGAVKRMAGRTRRGWVVHQLLRSIFIGEFHGGDRLVEEELAATIGVSRTPVREAFAELAGIGLIVMKPNRGAVVRTFGPKEMRDMYQIRWLLESEATRMATPTIDATALTDIRGETQRYLAEPRSEKWIAETVELDHVFHDLIRSSCGSMRLSEEIGRYRNLVRTIRQVVGNRAQAQDVALVEHTQIIDFMLARDADNAAAAMAQHIRRGTEAAVRALFGDRGSEVSVTIENATRSGGATTPF